MAGQPSSVNQMGLDCGTHDVDVPASTPKGRLKWLLAHQLFKSLGRNTQGLLYVPSVIGVRSCASRLAWLA